MADECTRVCARCHLTVAVGDGRGVTLALALLHGGWPEGLCTLIGWLTRVRQTLHRPHLLAQAALRRTLRKGNIKTKIIISLQCKG